MIREALTIAALRHPHVQVDVWGPGWAGYNASLSLSANVRRRAHRHDHLELSNFDQAERQRLRSLNRQARLRLQRSSSYWWSVLSVLAPPEPETDEIWSIPAWEDAPAGCGTFRWDIVWTISCVNLQRELIPAIFSSKTTLTLMLWHVMRFLYSE